ncbi:MAG: DNA-3-methyladenine glycosylase 2 family protein [Chitinophagaceae bacterium]|nr:DNA-3-methyladenine glycosylase 2 family protein [Chitinophagaceae bacterium]
MHYVTHLQKDRRLKKIIGHVPPFTLQKRNNIALYLSASIMSQQLSVKVADVIFRRFLALYNGKAPRPNQVLDTPFEALRSIGLSNAKTSYVQNVYRFALENGLELKKLRRMTDEEVIAYVTRIKGVGRWTAEMLLMFALQREDVFSADDLGIQTAIRNIYKLDHSNKKQFREEMLKISQKWAPYRTYACLYLWAWKDMD